MQPVVEAPQLRGGAGRVARRHDAHAEEGGRVPCDLRLDREQVRRRRRRVLLDLDAARRAERIARAAPVAVQGVPA